MALFPENTDNFTNREHIFRMDNFGFDIGVNNVGVNRSSRNMSSRMKPFKTKNCYTCYGECVFKAVDIAFLIGVIANICVITLVWRDRKLRKPTYISIACLAFCDALFLVVNLISSFEVVIRSLTCSHPVTFTGQAVSTVTGICWFAANAHVSVIALMRYILILHPLKSQLYLSNRKIIMSSACVWFIGTCIWMTILGLRESDILTSSKSVTFINVIWGIVYITPLTITVILHCRKWCHIRKAARRELSGNGSIQTTAVRMAKVILLVIILATVLPLPRYIIICLRTDVDSFRSDTRRMYLLDISYFLFLLNHAINPFVYAFMSKSFRKSFKKVILKQTDRKKLKDSCKPDSSQSKRTTSSILQYETKF